MLHHPKKMYGVTYNELIWLFHCLLYYRKTSEETNVLQGKSMDPHTNEEHKMATTNNEIHVHEPTKSTSSDNQTDEAMDTSNLQIDKPQPT